MATTTILPGTPDITAVDWTETGKTTHWECLEYDISEVPAGMDTDYIETTTIGHDFELTFTDSPGNTSEVTQIDLSFRGVITDASATARLEVRLDHSTGTPVTGGTKYIDGDDFGGYGVLGNHTLQYTGLTLTKAEADSLQVEVIFLEN